jgi:DNA-binding transcriptional LysR family regulator
MELKLLRTFLSVVELRHFGRAADALHMSHPALSKQVGALEASLGVCAADRNWGGERLTSNAYV